MFTHLHSIEWDFVRDFSTKVQRYFYNTIDSRIVAELETKKGVEFYQCSDAQMKTGNVGIYLGCLRKEQPGYRTLVLNHEDPKETETTISIDDEKYL